MTTPSERITTSGVATTRIVHCRAPTRTFNQRSTWVWPLPRCDGEAPCIVPCHGDPTAENIAIGYPGHSALPNAVPVFAAQDGIVVYATDAAAGAALCIDHADGWSTSYSDLKYLLVSPTDRFRRRRKERVRAGDVIGYAQRPSLRIRFAVTRLDGGECVAQDPATLVPRWSMLPWFGSGSEVPRALSDRLR